jgi:predicted transcriptional regulator
MSRKKTIGLTPAERRVMEALWRRGEATVREVADDLSAEKPVAYTTALTVLRVLTEKGAVKAREEGRAHVFRPLISETEARRKALRQLVSDFFGGSNAALAQHLLSEELTAKERARIEALLGKEDDE